MIRIARYLLLLSCATSLIACGRSDLFADGAGLGSSGEPEAGPEPASTSTTGDATDSGDGPSPFVTACVGGWTRIRECSPDTPGISNYERFCSDTERGIPSGCRSQQAAYWDCVATVPCNQLDVFPLPCADLKHAADAACDWCVSDSLSWANDCEFSRYCYDEDRRITCIDSICSCYESEQLVATCDAGMICSGDREELQACCGWSLGD